MLYYFLLNFPTGLKEFLTTYQIQLSSYFSHRVFGGEILKIMTFKMIKFRKSSVVYKDILMNTQEDFSKTMREDPEDYTRDFQEMALSKGEC
jgi:hypothetical protein